MNSDVTQISDKHTLWAVSFLFVQDDDEMYDEMHDEMPHVPLPWGNGK